MNSTELERYRTRLRSLVDRLQIDVEAITESARRPSGGQSGGSLTNAPMHIGDMGTDEYLQDLDATLMSNEEHLTEEVRAAMRRIDDGTFGQCEDCRMPIPIERLDAIPYARCCVDCAKSEEAGAPTVKLNASSGPE